jgi:iron complex transport system ATP-binding protein
MAPPSRLMNCSEQDRRPKNGRAVLHDFNLASRYGDGLALMNKGAIVAYGDPASVQRSDLMSDAFAVDLTVASEKPLVMPSRWLSEG